MAFSTDCAPILLPALYHRVTFLGAPAYAALRATVHGQDLAAQQPGTPAPKHYRPPLCRSARPGFAGQRPRWFALQPRARHGEIRPAAAQPASADLNTTHARKRSLYALRRMA